MRYLYLKDKLCRKRYNEIELYFLIVKALFYETRFKILHRRLYFYYCNLFGSYGSRTKANNRCIYSFRSNGVLRFFKVSRHFFRWKANNGLFVGVGRSSW